MIIPVSFDKLKNVVHISDVHIRLFRRHAEYKQAFEQLYEDIKSKNLEDFVIVLAGDIVHAKTDMSPEMVQVTSTFLENIANIAPTILIAGNHDCNLANSHRLDSLTPIVENLNHPDLYYARHSDVVTVADTDFAIFSILDERAAWPTPADCTSDNKVALYHGPVHGALTDANFTITNRHVHVDTFDGFDMVMLGDIHRHQVLQEFDESEGKPIIVYSSSLIQQNHGETIDGHGWCLWNVAERSFEFVELYNEYGYCTIEIENGKVTIPHNMPPKARVRLFTGDLENTKVKKIISNLKRKHSLIELSVNKNRFRQKLNINTSISATREDTNLNDPSTQMVFIEDWLKRNSPNLDPLVLSRIERLNTELNNRVSHDDQSRNIRWRPLVFKFSNMFSYGENNEIDFSQLNGLYGIFAPNASGKSSIMDSLMFCLYDKTPRAFRGHDIMNNRKDTFFCELEFEINDEVFVIRRDGTRKRNGSVKVDVDFYKFDESGDKISLNGESRRDTDAIIRNYVGSYEDFIMTALSGQTSNSLFIDKSHSERKDLLIQFMGLNIFDKLYTLANEEVKEISGVLKRFDKTEVTDNLAENHKRRKSLQDTLADLSVHLQLKEGEKNALRGMRQSVLNCKGNVPNISMSLEEMMEKRSTLETDKVNLHDVLKNKIEADINGEEYKIKQINLEINELLAGTTREKLAKLKDSIDKKYTEKQTLKRNLDLISSKITEKKNTKNKLSSYEYNEECSVCVENNKSVIEDLKTISNELSTLEDEFNEKTDKLENINTVIDESSDSLEKFSKIKTLDLDLGKHSTRLREAQGKKTASELKIESLDTRIEVLDEKIALYMSNRRVIEENEKLDKRAAEIQSQIDKISKEIKDVSAKITKSQIELSVLDSKRDDLKKKLEEAEELETTYEAYENYMSAISRNGVPYELIVKTIPGIQAEINDILSQIVDFSVSLEVDEKYINGKLSYDYDRIWPLENCSGMERFVSSLAIRVALMNISNLPKPNFLIIDEGFGTLDAEHLHSMQTLFNLLKTHFDFILIVSHLDNARDMVDNLIEIHKEDGYSQISV